MLKSNLHCRIHRRRRGSAIVYVIVTFTVVVGFASLAVDLGRVQLDKAQLQQGCDAAALAAASKSGQAAATIRSEAKQWAALNPVEGTAIALQDADIDIGLWNNGTFTVSAGGSAVRVNAYMTAARGNAVPLLFGSVLGRNSCDLSVQSIATMAPMGYGVIGLDYISMSGNSSDSYWSTSGYSSGNFGAIGSNGSISLSGSSSIHGDARPGVGKSVNGSGAVSGSTAPLTTALSYPAASAGAYEWFNSNSLVKMTSSSFYPKGNVTVPGGVYFFNNVDIGSNDSITFTGPTTIYIYGNLSMSGSADTNANLPKNLKIYMVTNSAGQGPGSISIGSSAALYADIYAPLSPITLSGSGDIYGSVVGKSVTMTGTSAIHYDLSLSGTGGAVALVK